MNGKSKVVKRAICMGAVSYLALTLNIPSAAHAQTATQSPQANLPAVTVDAPKPQVIRRAASRPSSRARCTSRSVARYWGTELAAPACVVNYRGRGELGTC